MIGLFADNGRSGFGITTALDIEGIPYRRLTRAEEFDARVLVLATHDLPPGAVPLLGRVPTVIIGRSAGAVREVFGVDNCQVAEGPVAIPLEEPIWPAAVRERAQSFGKNVLSIPWAPVCTPDKPPAGTVVACRRNSSGNVAPMVVRSLPATGPAGTPNPESHPAPVYWSLVDIGAAFTNLLDERYLPQGSGRPRPLPRWALALYYRAPEPLRRAFQRRTYAHLRRRLAAYGERAADYPVDATGWLLIELLKTLIREAAGELVRLAHWPTPYTAAAVLTHDLEPSRFAYTQGLSRLMRRVARSGHPATLSVVAQPATRYLSNDAAAHIRDHDVMCHGLEHRGETAGASREELVEQLGTARRRLERHLGLSIAGFRSPRLDRSADLLWALDRTGFRYDSSYPDVDRENVTTFGAGVRLNLPFRPPISMGTNHVRASRCLELPASAPDCIQPLFEGSSVRELRHAVCQKVAFIRATDGLFLGITHAGVFGPRDAARRGAHIGFVLRRLRHPAVWLANTSEIADWWSAREQLATTVRDGRVYLTNRGDRVVNGVRVVVERTNQEEHVYSVPPLAPGASTILELNHREGQDTPALRSPGSRALA